MFLGASLKRTLLLRPLAYLKKSKTLSMLRFLFCKKSHLLGFLKKNPLHRFLTSLRMHPLPRFLAFIVCNCLVMSLASVRRYPLRRILSAVPEVCSPGPGTTGAADRRHDRGGANTRLSGRCTARRPRHQVSWKWVQQAKIFHRSAVFCIRIGKDPNRFPDLDLNNLFSFRSK